MTTETGPIGLADRDTDSSVEPPASPEPTFVERVEKFVWLASGMFSVAALGLAFTGYITFAAYERAGASFLAAVAASGVFGITSLLKFGPPSE
jgi:hypothetical protein